MPSRYRYLLLSILVFWSSSNSLAQKSIDYSTPIYHKVFLSDDGFKIGAATDMVKDDEGWLWIGGQPGTNSNFQMASPGILLQRFNGIAFYSIDLPIDKPEELSDLEFEKRADGKIYVTLHSDKDSYLYLLDPKLLKFSKVELPKSTQSINQIQLIKLEKHFILACGNYENSKIYELTDDLNLKFKYELEENSIIQTTHYFAMDSLFLSNTVHQGLQLLDLNSNSVKQILDSDISPKPLKSVQKPLAFSMFTIDNAFFSILDHDKKLYRYDQKKNRFIASSFLHAEERNNAKIYGAHADKNGNVVLVEKAAEQIRLAFYPSNTLKNKPTTINSPTSLSRVYKASFSSKNYEVYSEDFSKEIFIAADGMLEYYVLENDHIKSFLPELSIRGIMSIGDSKLLVGTENEGWFVIDLVNSVTKNYPIDLNPFNPGSNRGYQRDESGIWSNCSVGILHVDEENGNIRSFYNYPISAMDVKGDSIFCGTLYYKLLLFSKSTGQYTELVDTDSLELIDVLFKKGKVYSATDKGLLIYQAGKGKLITPPNVILPYYFLCLFDFDEDHILLGSKDGIVYKYNIHTGIFQVIYEDDLSASIASIMSDDQSNLWYNTFAGIVKQSKKDSSEIRFTMADGLSHFECNRYSTCITADGHFVVGTIKGINYFHPDSLSKREGKAELRLSSLFYFDKEKDAYFQETNPNVLGSTESIHLPAEHPNLTIQFALFGILLKDDYTVNYRLNEENWLESNNKSTLELINLAPGIYHLEIRVSGKEKEQIGDILELDISADNFFYKTWWFGTIILALLSLLTFLYIRNLKEKQKQQEQFSRDIINSQEAERSRIAREIHDGVGQKLMLLSKKTSQLEEGQIHTLAKSSLNEIRTISRGLHPAILDRLGISSAIRSIIDDVDENTPIFFTHDIDKFDSFLSMENSLHLFRIVQEILNNLVKHSAANSATISIKLIFNKIVATFVDNGKGFDMSDQKNNKGLGMKTLRERSKMINSQFNMESSEGRGTKIEITIPISIQ